MEDIMQSFNGCFALFSCLLPSSGYEDVMIGAKRYRVKKQLAEGGYSFVFLVEEVQAGLSVEGAEFALKRVLAATGEAADMADREIRVMQQLQHPNIMTLLAHSRAMAPIDADQDVTTYYMLFPLYKDGSLVDLLDGLSISKAHLPVQDVLSIFFQVCCAVQAMHQQQPPLAHRDLKPHNVLVRRDQPDVEAARRDASSASPSSQQAEELKGNGEAEPLQSSHSGQTRRYHAVLMDFGSTRPARVEVRERRQALEVQEEAQAHSSAPYRAPELFDVPSRCSIDERTDVWSLGCLLYFLMYGCSPFEKAISEAGGSLLLAVLNGQLSYPSPDVYPSELQGVIQACLTVDPAKRPYVEDVRAMVQDLLVRCPDEHRLP